MKPGLALWLFLSLGIFAKKISNFAVSMGRYKFRKMYFVCGDKKVIEPRIPFTNAYQDKEHAEMICRQMSVETHFIWEPKDKPVPKRTVEAFYLVPEKLYEEILKKYVEGENT